MHHNCVSSKKLKSVPFYVIMPQYGGTGKLCAIDYDGAGEIYNWLSGLGLADWEYAGFLSWAEFARPGDLFKSEYFVVVRASDSSEQIAV